MQPDDDFSHQRVNYERDRFDESDAAADPLEQFGRWFDAAKDDPTIVEPYAMALATVDDRGRPTSRIVLLRGYDDAGLAFFTNYESRKGEQIGKNPAGALLFWWGILQRQIRIEGRIEKLAERDSDAYFSGRPRGHRLSAWASQQSRIVPNRGALETAMTDAETRFPGDVPRPSYWGGYRLVPEYYEFWQGRRSRVHDRIAYDARGAERTWNIERLSP